MIKYYLNNNELCNGETFRCVSTAKAIPKDKAIKRFLVRYV